MAYIASQKPEGWIAFTTGYDDGGVSGATLGASAINCWRPVPNPPTC